MTKGASSIISSYPDVVLGCDPEFFFSRGGAIIGSERILSQSPTTALVIDGVQAELNPEPSSCREDLALHISSAMIHLRKHLNQFEGVTASFSGVIEVDSSELAALSEASSRLGCGASKNIHRLPSTSLKKIDASTYRVRSAGGHIHFGRTDDKRPKWLDPSVITLLDIMLGNTCVMLDKGAEQKERRKLYGRAGEYRTPPHGLEYRTLSNFWLRSYPLMSFVMGLARQTLAIKHAGSDHEQALLDCVNLDAITQAINENDHELAGANWVKVREFIKDRFASNSTYPTFSLDHDSLHLFDHFVSRGIDYWFKEDPLEHWCLWDQMAYTGWERFNREVVGRDFLSIRKDAVAS